MSVDILAFVPRYYLQNPLKNEGIPWKRPKFPIKCPLRIDSGLSTWPKMWLWGLVGSGGGCSGGLGQVLKPEKQLKKLKNEKWAKNTEI
jgi:hypothetical protein